MTKPQHSSNLYEESLLEIDKYKEVAMQEAKRAVLDSITPLIKKQLDINLNALTEQQTKLFEEEDPFAIDNNTSSSPQPPPTEQTPPAGPVVGEPTPPLPLDNTTPPVAAPAPTDIATTQPEPTTDLPVSVPSSTGLNIPMPDASGKIVVDLSLLLAGSGDLLESPPLTPEQPDITGGAVDPTNPPPTDIGGFPDSSMTPAPPAEGLESNPFKEWKSKFTKLYGLTESVKTQLGKQTLIEKLSECQEQLIELKESNKLSDDKFDIYNTFVENFYNVLKGNINESNIYSKNIEEVMLNRKKSSVAQFAQSLFLTETTHAGFGDGDKVPKGKEELGKDESSKHAMKISGKKPEDPGKAKALVVETDETSEPTETEVTTEVKQPDGPKDESEGWTKAKVANKKAKLKEEADKIAKQLQECEQMESTMMSDDIGGGSTEERVGNVTLHADNVTIVTSGEADTDLSGMSDDDEIELVDDEGSDEQDTSFGGDDLTSDEDEDDSVVKSESYKRLQKEHRELQLVTAQSLYLNKLFAKEGVTLGMKKKITEYMDKAKSLTEAKEVYFKLKTTLDENLNKFQGENKGKLVENKGATASSSATPAKKVVNENTTTNQSGPFSTERFMHLAGIAKK